MHILASQLIGLPVVTKSGQPLGRIVDLEIAVDSHAIGAYHVRSRWNIAGLLGRNLLIVPRQVISITAQRMTVEDNLGHDRVISPSPLTPEKPASPAMNSDRQ